MGHLTPSRTSRPRSRTKRESHQISKDSFLPESNSRMAEPLPTTTSKKSPPSTSSSDSEEAPRRGTPLFWPLPRGTELIRKFAVFVMPDSQSEPQTAERKSAELVVIS